MSAEVTNLEVLDSMDPVLRKKIAAAELHHTSSRAPAAMEAAELKRRYDIIQQTITDVMVKDVDYGTIPGAGDGKMLFKPGAEKLGVAFGLVTSFEAVTKIENWDAGLFHYEMRCDLRTRDGQLVASANGSCNTRESKYRYRWVTKPKPSNGDYIDDMVNRGMAKLKTTRNGEWYQERVENPDPFDLINTVQKMAAKRAHVAAIRIGLGVSGIFEDGESPAAQTSTKPERTPSLTDRTNTAKSALIKTIMRAAGVDKKTAGKLAGERWKITGEFTEGDVQALLVDTAIELAKAKTPSPLELQVRELAADAKHLDAFVAELLKANEATQDEWLTALRDSDDASSLVDEHVEGNQ